MIANVLNQHNIKFWMGLTLVGLLLGFSERVPVLSAPLNLPPSQTISSNTNFQGGTWASGTSTLTVNPGVTATLDNGNTFTFSTTSNPTVTGGGTFANDGVFDHSSGGLLFVTNDTNFDNTTNGTLNFNNANGRIHFNGGANGNFRNLGGTINANANNILMDSNGLFTTFDGSTLHDLNLNVNTSATMRILAAKTGGQVQLNTLTVASGSELTFSTPSTFTQNGGGAINFNQPGTIKIGNFGMGADVNFSAGGNEFIGGTIPNNGNNLTVVDGNTLKITGGTSTFSGTGRFINNEIVDLDFSNLIFVNNGAKFENNDTLNFNNTNARIHLNGGTHGTFRNYGGTINSGATNALIDGNSGFFTTFDGSTLHDLNLNVTSGDFTLNVGTGGQAQLNTVNVASGAALTLSNPATFTQNGGGAINFNQPGRVSLGNFGMGADVLLDAGGDHGFIGGTIVNNGNDMTLASGRNLNVTGGVNFTGTGTFFQNGTIDLNTSGIFFVIGGAKLDNTDTINFIQSSARIHLNGGANGTFRNFGGTINSSSTNALLDGSNGFLSTFDGSTLHDLNINITSGNFTMNIGNGDQVQLNTINVPSGSIFTLSNPAVFTQNGGGDINFNQPGRVVLGNFGMGADVNLDAGENHGFLGGTIQNNGNDMTLFSGRTADMTAQTNFLGTGTFINNGTFNHNTANLLFVTTGATFENNGTYSQNTNAARLHLNGGANGTINNTLTGVITKDAAIAATLIDGTNGTFNNLGTIFVPGGELEIGSMAFTQFSAGSLTGGTYSVDSTATGTAILDLLPAGVSNTITTIGTNAAVELIGTGANFNQLGNALSTLNGGLMLSEGKQFTVNSLNMGSTAELTFGLDSLVSSNALLTVSGNLTVDGLINIENLGGLEVGVYDLVNFGGTLTDNGLAIGNLPPGFDDPASRIVTLLIPASGTTGGIIQLQIEIAPIPEPGSMTLLGLGLLGTMLIRRRKARKV